MDGAAHTVGQLGIELRQLVLGVHAGVGDVSHGGSLHDVPDDELLDGLVLGAGLGAVGAPDELDMATAMLVTSIVSTLGSHLDSGIKAIYKHLGVVVVRGYKNTYLYDDQHSTATIDYIISLRFDKLKDHRSTFFLFVFLRAFVFLVLHDQGHSPTHQHSPQHPL